MAKKENRRNSWPESYRELKPEGWQKLLKLAISPLSQCSREEKAEKWNSESSRESWLRIWSPVTDLFYEMKRNQWYEAIWRGNHYYAHPLRGCYSPCADPHCWREREALQWLFITCALLRGLPQRKWREGISIEVWRKYLLAAGKPGDGGGDMALAAKMKARQRLKWNEM